MASTYPIVSCVERTIWASHELSRKLMILILAINPFICNDKYTGISISDAISVAWFGSAGSLAVNRVSKMRIELGWCFRFY